LFAPAEAKKWAEAGGINFLNDQRELIAAALKYKGYSLNDKDEAHLNEAKEVILAVKPLVKTFNSEDYSESLMIPGEIAISHSWNGQAATAYWETYDEATGTSQWAYVIPSEGAMIYQDNMCIPATSQRKATAEHFINYLLEPEVGAAITNVTYYASANEAAKPFVSEEILNDPSIYPPEEVMNKLEWAEKLDETMFVYDRIWTEIKSQ
ncbi:MAG TPA: extracellular solute-binding protein, partial [Anaerolineae bacterium]|nr:extracellular solute-binding protein [Anaerolineae bacterium]